MIAGNLSEVERGIRAACEAAGRPRESVTLVGVSKRHPAEAILEAIRETVLRDFGENYVQEYLDKRAALEGRDDGARYHFIGHLQRNKVRSLLSRPPHLIHSVDSIVLLAAIERVRAELYPNASQDILLELRIGDEDSEKTGLNPDDFDDFVDALGGCPHVRCRGLMIIPPAGGSPEESRPYFRRVREMFEAHNASAARNEMWTVLSYGMSADYGVAIEEGATHIRVGTAIFGARV